MAYFKNSADDWQRLDWRVLRDGGIALYWRSEYLAEDTQWLKTQDYVVYDFDCAGWRSLDDMFEDFGRVLQLPDWWGHNLNALNDLITDLPLDQDHGAVIVLRHFDSFASNSQAILALNIFAGASRFYLLSGRRLIVLVQSDDPNIRIEPLGGAAPRWNSREWLNANRNPSSR